MAELVEEVTDDKKLEKQERKRLQVEHAHKKSQRAKILKLAQSKGHRRKSPSRIVRQAAT